MINMHTYTTAEEAKDAVEDLFNDEASRAFMTPVLCMRHLVTSMPDGRVVIALGGGGIYGTRDAEGAETHHAVAKVETAVILDRDVAITLAAALNKFATLEGGDGE